MEIMVNFVSRSVAVVMVGLGAVVVAACTSAEPNRGLSNIRLAGDDGNDQLSLNCSNRGRVRVNDGRPAEGPIACADVVSIVVDGVGGDDQIRLERLNPSDFGSLQSIRLEGGDGDDWIYASHATDLVVAGTGDDVISGDLPNDDLSMAATARTSSTCLCSKGRSASAPIPPWNRSTSRPATTSSSTLDGSPAN